MKVLFDSSVIVEIERNNNDSLDIAKKLIDGNHGMIISSVTISEILTGSYLKKNFEDAVKDAKNVLGQFLWVDMDAAVAEKTAQYMSYLITEGKMIEFPDIAIAATFKISNADYMLTLNKQHFENLPDLENKIFTPKEFKKLLDEREKKRGKNGKSKAPSGTNH